MCQCTDAGRIGTESDTVSIYDRYIGYIRHENELINQRTTWLVTIEGGLLLILCFLVQKYFEVANQITKSSGGGLQPLTSGQLKAVGVFAIFWALICATGIISAVSARKSIKAAIHAQQKLKELWNTKFLKQAETFGLPPLTGGGSEIADVDGGKFADSLPVILIVIWILIIGLLLSVLGITIVVSVA